MKESTIKIDVQLDEGRVPQAMYWNATDSTAENRQECKALMLNFWDGKEKSNLRIDLWTNQMMVDEMVDFYFQCFMGMADTLQRSTGQQMLVDDLRNFAQSFFQKFAESQRNENAHNHPK